MQLRKLLEKKAQSNASLVTVQLLRKLNVPITTSTVIESLERHPDYPSLYSISDNLQKWKVENLALKVEGEKLEELPVPFIAHGKTGGGNFMLVNNVNGLVDFIDDSGKQRKKTREEFIKNWNNVVLLAEKTDQAGEKNYKKNRRKEILDAIRIPAIILGCLSLIALSSIIFASVFVTSLLLLKFAGSIVAGLLLWFEIDHFNPVTKQICSAGKKINCMAILNSKQSKVFNSISWGEVGFFYFAGGFLFLLITANWQLQTLSVLSWLNLFALPYTVFSVFYQWRIVKQWCPLCLTVQVVLISEFIACYFGYWSTSKTLNFSGSQLIPLLTAFFLPMFFWIATKKIFWNAQDGIGYKKELFKLKYNKEIFNALLSKQQQITKFPEGLGITLGNPNASNTIIKVCNPYCGPCAKAHPVIDEILENNLDVKVQIIFTATNDENDIKAMPVKHLMALNEKGEAELIKCALDDWYTSDEKEYAVFAAKYVLNGEIKMQGEKLEAMDAWCKETGILFTPTFFVNGYKLPEIYTVEDLKHLI